MEFIDIAPELGTFLLDSASTCMQDFCHSIYIAQSMVFQSATSSYTISMHTSPYFLSKLSQMSKYHSGLVSLSPLYIKSISQTSSFISNAEYICRTCCETFNVPTDLTWSNTIHPPFHCKAFTVKSLPHSKVPGLSLECEGTLFDLLEGSLIYSDYQEFLVSDGKHDMLVVVQGGLCNTFRIGECVEITGVYVQKWNQSGDSEYAFICFGVSLQPSSLLKVGVQVFQQQRLQSSDFHIRESIIKSSFSGIYGNYNVKLALILNTIGRLSGLTFSTLVLGGISTGKSSIAKLLIRLFPDECRIINAALTNSKAFSQQKIKNDVTGKYEAGLLESEYILVIDNFQVLEGKKFLYKAMETKSIIAMVETNENDKDFNNDLNKHMKLSSEYDRFDMILPMKNYENNSDFRVKKLGNYALEDYSNLWDFDTIKSYLYGNLRNHSEIMINSPKVQTLLHGFISYIVNYNLKNCDMPVASGVSVRLLESLIKISKANAILLGHEEVTIFDAIDALLLINCSDVPDLFVNLEVYKATADELLNAIQSCIGELPLF